ncbi:hypothetical protein GF314_13350 [bacterium]|nr:hypothetical protein [bacterium]
MEGVPDMTTEARITTPDLRDRRDELQATGDHARRLASPLTARQLWWRPSPRRWSIGECLDHVVLAGEAYLDVLDPAIAVGWAEGRTARERARPGLFGRALLRGLEPPAKLRIPAPSRIRPRRPDPQEAEAGFRPGSQAGPLKRFLELRPRFTQRLEAADGLDLRRVRVRSPFVPLVTIDLDTALRILPSHERRHLWQAENVRRDDDFPAEDTAATMSA